MMNQHNTADRQVIPAPFISFLLAGGIGLLGDSLLNRPATAFKFADAIFITGCILVAMKFARKGWDLPAAGYTVLSIARGILSGQRFCQPGDGGATSPGRCSTFCCSC